MSLVNSDLEMDIDSIPCRVVLMLTTKCFELVSVIILQRWILPFFLRFKEHGEGISADNGSVIRIVRCWRLSTQCARNW